tara:strand:+ start:1102 stop:1380 length:279 start_codon:yes stop_codon:yes gene_type:complete
MPATDFECSHCGAEVSPNATGCPQCGAQKRNGQWFGPESDDGIGLADNEFDYDDFVAREFGAGTPKKTGKELFWWIVAIIVTIAFALLIIPF